MEEARIKLDDYNDKIKDRLETIGSLIISHPEIPDDIDQSELLTTIRIVGDELEKVLENRVPEINTLNAKIENLKHQNDKLKETNQKLFLSVKEVQKEDVKPMIETEKPKPSWEQIKSFISNMR